MSRIEQPPSRPANTTARKTEDTDTRQALHRHDPEFYRKKKNEGEQPGFKDPYEDLTDVSVAALRNFLLGLLDRMPQGEAAPAAETPHAEPVKQPANPKAAAAINAYQSGASRGMAPPPPPPPLAPAATTGTALDQAAANLDKAMVLDLIRDLDRLAATGVIAITLEKGEGFLLSIRGAIDRAKASFAGP